MERVRETVTEWTADIARKHEPCRIIDRKTHEGGAGSRCRATKTGLGRILAYLAGKEPRLPRQLRMNARFHEGSGDRGVPSRNCSGRRPTSSRTRRLATCGCALSAPPATRATPRSPGCLTSSTGPARSSRKPDCAWSTSCPQTGRAPRKRFTKADQCGVRGQDL